MQKVSTGSRKNAALVTLNLARCSLKPDRVNLVAPASPAYCSWCTGRGWLYELGLFQMYISWVWSLLDSDALLFVHVSEHEADVRGEEVVHFIPETGLAEQFTSSNQVTNCHVEICVPTWPVGDTGKRMCDQNILDKTIFK